MIRKSLHFLFFLPALISLSVMGCASGSGSNVAPALLPYPDIPEYVVDPEARAAWLALHFWDSLDFSDTTLTHDADFMERNFANYAAILGNVADTLVLASSAEKLINLSEVDTCVFKMVGEFARYYLYSDEAPLLPNEEAYIPFMRYYVSSPRVGETDRYRYDFMLECALKNRPGHIAADFRFVTREGEHKTLHSFDTSGNILLIFYDPDCDTCREIMERLASDASLLEMAVGGELTVMAIYAGEDRDLWEATAARLPQEWVVGYDQGAIEEAESYDFRQSPTLYLLSSDKRVITKEIPPTRLLPN